MTTESENNTCDARRRGAWLLCAAGKLSNLSKSDIQLLGTGRAARISFSKNLRTIIGESGSGLALGEIQRILIARALAQKPRILVLDEAMSALGGASQTHVIESLSR